MGLIYQYGPIRTLYIGTLYIYIYIQVSRVPKLIPSLGRPAASLARAVHSVCTECLFLLFCGLRVTTGGDRGVRGG